MCPPLADIQGISNAFAFISDRGEHHPRRLSNFAKTVLIRERKSFSSETRCSATVFAPASCALSACWSVPAPSPKERIFDLQKDKKIVAKTENFRYNNFVAPIAQLVEHFTRNEGVVSSSLIRSFFHLRMSESEGL